MKKLFVLFFCLIKLVSYGQTNLKAFVNTAEFRNIESNVKQYGIWADDIHSNDISIKEHNNSLEWSKIGRREGEGGPHHTLFLTNTFVIFALYDVSPGSGKTLVVNRKNFFVKTFPYLATSLLNNELKISKTGTGFDNTHKPTGRYWQSGVIDLSTLNINWGNIER